MHLAISLAVANVEHGGGPFGAVVTDEAGRVISVGVNSVVSCCNSTHHAEMQAIQNAQHACGTHDLSEGGPYILYSSCAPCVMCFGAVWWSGLTTVYAAANKADAESVGFSEGPVTPAMWDQMLEEKGVTYVPEFCRSQESYRPFELFKNSGTLY